MAVKSSSNDLFLPYIYQNNNKLLNLFIYNWTRKKKNEEDLKKSKQLLYDQRFEKFNRFNLSVIHIFKLFYFLLFGSIAYFTKN